MVSLRGVLNLEVLIFLDWSERERRWRQARMMGRVEALNVRRLLGISFHERFPATADSRFQCGGDDGAPIGPPV